MPNKFRFYSDTDEANFSEAAKAMGVGVEFDGHDVEVPDELVQSAIDCKGVFVQDERTSSGADGFLDTGAFSVRSDAAKMPYHAPEPVKTVFFKVERRTTRGQP